MKRRDLLKGSTIMSFGMLRGGNAGGAVNEDPFPPKKIIKKSPAGYSPLAYLERVDNEITPRLAFRAVSRKEAQTWQTGLREKLWELLGETGATGGTAPAGRLLDSARADGYTREKWELDIVPGRTMPVYVLRPDGMTAHTKTVLCLHGHGNGARDIINMPVDDDARELIRVINTGYAEQCVRRGWCAVAPELFTFGERTDYVEDARPGFDGGCEKPFLNAVQVGKTLIGIRAKDICTLIDWMDTRNDINTEDLACIGISGGGMMTMYVSALDTRVNRAIISGYMTEMKDSILALRHCSCNYVPRLAEWADFPDIGGLIAPRYLIIQSGKRDGIFPIESVRRAYEKIRSIYSVYGIPERVSLHEHDGFHSFWNASLDELFKPLNQ